MRRARAVLMFVLLGSSPSRAEEPALFGATVGMRLTDLQGQIDTKVSGRLAVAGIVAFPSSPWWRLILEPGVRGAGSEKYALTYVSVPFLAQLTLPFSTGAIVRGTAGLMANVLVQASVVDDSSTVDARRWDFGVVAGIGIEQRHVFAEVRWSRGLGTIHAADPALFIVNTELGLWIGVLR